MPACPRAEVHTHSLPMARELLRHRLHGRIFPLLTACFGDEADVVQPDDLFVYDSLVIWYDAGHGLGLGLGLGLGSGSGLGLGLGLGLGQPAPR